MAAVAIAPCLVLPCKPKTLSHVASNIRICNGALPRHFPIIKTLAFSSNLSSVAFSNVGTPIRALEKPKPMRRSVVCEAATTRKPDSASKRARQAEKRRIYNKAKKSEVKTRMRKVFEELDILKKKTDAKAEEIRSVEELIAKAYSAIDKAVKSGTLHKNTGAHRKSRLARRKKTVEIHHGWYIPAVTA